MTVLFPLADSDPEELAAREQPGWRTGEGTVLVVDDDDAVRRAVTRILTEAGYEVVGAPNGDVALEVLAERAVDVVVLDVTMPGRDGYATLAALRETRPETEVILSSGKPMDRAPESDAHLTLLPKPYAPDALVRAIAEARAAAEESAGER